MATLNSVINFARAQTQTDSNGITDANGIIFANEALYDIHQRLIDGGIDASQIQESYQSFTPGTGTYTYPTDMRFLKTIELNYTDSSQQNFIKASQIDISNTPNQTSFQWLRLNASPNLPLFDDHGDWFEVFPTPTTAHNSTNAMRIYYFLQPTEFSSTSDSISYPISQDYRILGWRIAINYLKSIAKMDLAAVFQQEYETKMKKLISTLGRGSEQPIQATPITFTGFEF